MIAILMIGALVALDRLVAKVRVDHLLLSPESLALLAISLLVASALAIQRLISTNRTLKSRQELAVIPADDFDPKTDTVLRFAAELAGTQRGFQGWKDRRASGLRVRLTGDAKGRLVYLLSAPERSLRLVRAALDSYEGVEIREASEVLGERSEDDLATVRTELRLARPSLEPLARLKLDPDPLQHFAAAMSSIRPELGDDVDLCLDLLPGSGGRRARLQRSLRRRAKRQYGDGRTLLESLEGSGRSPSRPGPDQLLERRLVNDALEAKLRDSGALFEAQILIRCRAKEHGRAKTQMEHLRAAFEPFSAQNWLRACGLRVFGVTFLGSDLPLRRARFDRRLDSGLFRPARGMILTASELAGFLKPPSVHCRAARVARAGMLLSAPPSLPVFEKERADIIPLGKVGAKGGDRVLGVRVADTFFACIAGRSRYGKTESAIAQFVHLVRSGHGGLFLDPHGDALDRIKPYLDCDSLRERIVEIDLGPGHMPGQPGWNLFGLGREEGGEGRVGAIVDAFSSVLDWGERSTRAINLTTHSAAALVAISRVLPPELAPTIFQLPTLLSNQKWREAVLPFLPRTSQRFWLDRFRLLSEEAITPITNLVDRLQTSSAITTLLGQSQSTFSMREAMDKGQIVLACPGDGQAQQRLVANLMVFDLLHSARQRGQMAPTARTSFWAFLDEVQSYDGGSSGSLAALLEQSAKFGIRAVLLNQNPERLTPKTLNALMTNRSHLMSSALNSHAAALVTKEWGGEPSPSVLTGLPRFSFVTQVTHEGELSQPFYVRGIRVEDIYKKGEDGSGYVGPGAATLADRAEVHDHLETLDDRILAHLQKIKSSERPGAAESEAQDDPFWLEREGV